MKKLFALLLAVVMVLGLVACAQPANPTTTTKAPANTTAGNDDTTASTTAQTSYFPLKEETTLKLAINMTNNDKGLDEMAKALEANVLWSELLEKTNVKIELVGWTDDTITAMFANDEMGDIILCGGSGKDNMFNGFAAEGVLAALEDYVDDPEICPNMAATIWAELPEARSTFTNTDGHLYTMGTYTMDVKKYVEGYLWVYKPWLDAAEMEIPTTLEEYEAFMEYVVTHDMNGNGKEDEVGVYFGQNVNKGIESFLGLYGLPTKDGTWENYVTLVDGTDETVFIPQMDEWKDFLKLFNKWWEAGYINEGCFTDTWDTTGAEHNPNKTDTVQVASMYAAKLTEWVGAEGYVYMAPIQLGEAPIRWYLHPGYMGSKTCFAIPEASENVELAVRFMDLFYDKDVTVRVVYGEENSPRRSMLDDGTFMPNTIDNALWDKIWDTPQNYLSGLLTLPTAWGEDNLALVMKTESDAKSYEAYEAYKPYLNQTVWPRPFTPAEDQDRLTELRTDIFNLVNEKRAEWITGRADIDAEWDQFQEDLLDAGIEEFIEIMQNAYDMWYANYSKVAG